jgi:hypothetical protein
MKIVNEKPPNYEKIIKAFPHAEGAPVIFCYGDTIYDPVGGKPLPEHLVKHEFVHSKQQEEFGGPEKWWDEYIANPTFRFEQEVEAYAVQYKFSQTQLKAKWSDKFLDNLARDLSSPVYGGVADFHKARAQIKRISKLIVVKE